VHQDITAAILVDDHNPGHVHPRCQVAALHALGILTTEAQLLHLLSGRIVDLPDARGGLAVKIEADRLAFMRRHRAKYGFSSAGTDIAGAGGGTGIERGALGGRQRRTGRGATRDGRAGAERR
jgi:hypothetical protein